MKKFVKNFSEFINKGNILSLAIGIIIGGSFNTVVRSLVNDIIMPLIGLIGGKNVQESKIVLVPAVLSDEGTILVEAVTLNYGSFLQALIDFFIIALSIYFAMQFVKGIRKVIDRNKVEEKVDKLSKTDELLIEIKEILKENQKG